ncbi:MAG: hypothetical protein EXS05_09995 [Planctomycetaceae bacterium]|nr:hypothetical protein [Planctomycetaceae bacterium]
MKSRTLCGSLAALFVWLAALPASAQDFRVYTRTSYVREDVKGPEANRPSAVSRCTSLFHAGKVYDCVDSVNQMTIYEPAHQRFVVIDGSRRRATVITFDDISTLLHRYESRDAEQLAKSKKSRRHEEIKLANYLELQIHPKFQERYDEAARLLEFSSGSLKYYSVKCDPAATPERVAAYLDYADWAARLNCIVNPRAPLPGPRLKLNDALRKHTLLPIEVTLKTEPSSGYHKTAEHQFVWKLNDEDRKIIRHWEMTLGEPDIKPMSLEEFLKSNQKDIAAPTRDSRTGSAASKKGAAIINPASARTRGGAFADSN